MKSIIGRIACSGIKILFWFFLSNFLLSCSSLTNSIHFQNRNSKRISKENEGKIIGCFKTNIVQDVFSKLVLGESKEFIYTIKDSSGRSIYSGIYKVVEDVLFLNSGSITQLKSQAFEDNVQTFKEVSVDKSRFQFYFQSDVLYQQTSVKGRFSLNNPLMRCSETVR